MPDHYTYSGTEVLVKIPGYTDPGLWKAAEGRVITTHMADLAIHIPLLAASTWPLAGDSRPPHAGFSHVGRVVAGRGHRAGIEAFLYPALLPVAEANRRDELREILPEAGAAFFALCHVHTSADLDQGLRTAIGRRTRPALPFRTDRPRLHRAPPGPRLGL